MYTKAGFHLIFEKFAYFLIFQVLFQYICDKIEWSTFEIDLLVSVEIL
jgi:hypothetical protein